MADKLTKTGRLDALIKADLGNKEEGTGSYAKGQKQVIVAQVMSEIEGLDIKNMNMLFFSRRAVISKAVRDRLAEAVTA